MNNRLTRLPMGWRLSCAARSLSGWLRASGAASGDAFRSKDERDASLHIREGGRGSSADVQIGDGVRVARLDLELERRTLAVLDEEQGGSADPVPLLLVAKSFE